MHTCLRTLLSLSLCGAASVSVASEQVIGWLEYVQIAPQGITMDAKIDTGADNSSLHADNIQMFDKSGEQWVRFNVENTRGEVARFELPVKRMAYIKRRGGGDPIARPVVNMGLCVGTRYKQADINLADRSNFEYRMLIGRSYLEDSFLVNVSKAHTADPQCGAEAVAQAKATN